MDTNELQGLSAAEVQHNRKQSGYNELPDREKRSIIKIIISILTEPMIFLLVAAVAVYAFLGDKTEALVLSVSVLVVTLINLFQDLKTEKALDALRSLASPTCTVIREGKHQTIPGRELVPGDIVLISEGGRVPADGKLLSGQNLAIDESLLTGESIPVDKKPGASSESKQSLVFSSSMVVKGHGIMQVSAIGLATEVGKIGDSLRTIKPEKTLLKKEIERIVKIIAIVAISASLLLTLVFWLTRGNLAEGFLAGLTLAISILPEEFPVVFTVFMALGAWRLAKNQVLSRNSSTIETLGSASVLCTDKTGTLTENRMSIMQITDEKGAEIALSSDQFREVLRSGVLASQKQPFDPMEEAFIHKAGELYDDIGAIYGSGKILREFPLEKESLSVAHVWGGENGKISAIGLKGAPEAVFALCKLSPDETDKLHEVVKKYASQGLRVLGVASGAVPEALPEKREDVAYTFLGLVALADPIRKEAAPAVKLCRQAGIRVIMITGDYPETARRIGGEIGMDNAEVVTGEQLSQMSPEEQEEAIKRVSIFSRVLPENKLTIVETLKRNGEVVAMTGDGVNDAPALKSAHIGIAMGKRGTDVAREASSIVLLDDNFASIVRGIALGRRIFANLQKAMTYILTVHVPIIVMSLLPVLFGWPLVLLPIHIVFLEFIIDSSCTLIFESEPEEPDSMQKRPRPLNSALFNRSMLLISMIEGLVISAVALGIHYWTILHHWPENKSRSLTFLMIVLMNIALIFVISGRRAVMDAVRQKGKSPLPIIMTIVVTALLVVYLSPVVSQLFKFDQLSPGQLAGALVIAVLTALTLKPLRHLITRKVH